MAQKRRGTRMKKFKILKETHLSETRDIFHVCQNFLNSNKNLYLVKIK